jgi:predicted nucleic acid-binding Zn ribbon protein
MKIEIKYPETKCAYCGKTFKKQHNRQTYCSEECAYQAHREKHRIRNMRYYYRHKDRINKTKIGTRTIGPNPDPDPEREAQIVQNEIERIGLHIF